MCGNEQVCIDKRMPASSGDPVGAALHMSLAGNKCPTLKNDDLDSIIIASTQRVLLTEIQYERAESYTNTVLDSLKSKYIVLNANISDSKVDIKIKNECKESPLSKDSVCTTSVSSPKKVKSEVTLPTPKRVLFPPEAIQLGWQTSTPIGSGMVNLRYTCYLNSTLQALFHVPAFVNWILNDKIHSSKCGIINGTGHTECLICAVMRTLQSSQHNSGNPIKPVQIYSKLKLICKHFDHGHQEDAHEFLRYLIESMERSYLTIVQGTKLDSYSKETTPLNQIFGGYIRTEVTCLECRHVSITFQHFQDLLLDIRTVGSVDDALEAYFGREQLGEGEEAYRCEQCHRRVAATKKFSIQKAPNVLCIQLKRFGILGGKISKHVSLKQKLNLSKYIHPSSPTNGDLTYRLVSLISHIGPSSSCGHYTAIASSSNGIFYLFDDSMVRQVPLQTVLSTNAYVIMYELEPLSTSQRPVKPAPAFTLKSNSNGVNGKSLQNGLSQSPLSIHKQTLVLSSSKAERLTATNSSAVASSSVSSSSSLTTVSSQLNSPLKQSKMLNGTSSPSKSLVPYTPNESSDSESENAVGYRSNKQFSLQTSTSKECTKNSIVLSTVNGTTKEVVQKSQSLFTSFNNKSSLSKESSSTSVSKVNFASSSSSSPLKSSAISNTKTDKVSSSVLPSMANQASLKKSPTEDLPALIMNVWTVSESLNSPNSSCGSSSGNSISNNVGQWNVTEINKSRSSEKVETVTTECKISAAAVGTVTSNSLNHDNITNNNNVNGSASNKTGNSSNRSSSSSSNSSTNSLTMNLGNSNSQEDKVSSTTGNGKMWDGSRNNETVSELLKLSHRGYGTSSVNSWNGGKSEIDKEVENDKVEQRKRSLQSFYDEDMDRGKVKKIKSYAYSSSSKNENGTTNGRRYNPFQEQQNRKNSWHNNSKRHLFYQNYNNVDRYRNNHRVYHNQNGFNHWRH